MQTSRHGTRWQLEAGRLVASHDRHGTALVRLRWDGARLVEATVAGAPGRWLTVDGALVDDALVGPAHALRVDDHEVTRCGAVDWARPTIIPAIADPARLPPLTGTALLSVIALLSHTAGVPSLRYAGSYPSAALWSSLQQCFTTAGDEAAFTADAVGRIARGARDPLPVEFAPAPFERVWVAPDVAVQLRDDLDRAIIDGLAYAADGSPRRLVADGDDRAAELWFGDHAWTRVATFAADGELRDGPHPLPAVTSRVVGAVFPPPLRDAIADLLADLVSPLLVDDARAYVTRHPLRWADLGAHAARATDDGLAVHAMIWERLAPHGLARVALALAEALAPVVTRAVIAEVARHRG
jgi:hypothetical protein